MTWVPTLLVFSVFLAGIFGVVFSKNLIKTIISINIIQTAGILLFIFTASKAGDGIPVLGADIRIPVDPLPQALMITAIVIGASVTALAMMMSIKVFHYYGSLDWKDFFDRED